MRFSMCLVVTLVMFGVAIQSFMQHQWIAGIVQSIIALGFMALLIRNILIVRNKKSGCTTAGCGSPKWLLNLFKKEKSE